MATGAKLGYGSLLKRGNGASPQTFITIAEVISSGRIGQRRELKEVTNLSSPNASREYILGLKDGAELSVTANFLPLDATQSFDTGLIKDAATAAIRDFKLDLTDNYGVLSFSALVLSWEVEVSAPEAMVATFGLKISGDIGWQAL